MKTCPKVGSRVKFKGNLVVGPCAGVVEKIYPQEEWEDDDGIDVRPTGRMMPEKNWHVRMKVDAIPAKWCYDERGVFAPEVCELTRA